MRDGPSDPFDGDDPVAGALSAVAEVGPEVRAGLPGRRETAGRENESGETVTAADVHADELLEAALAATDGVGAYASEERTGVVDLGADPAEDGVVSVAADPLDGSSNLDSNNPMGTIVGVYDDPLPATGRSLVGSAFVLYGPLTTMTVARDGRVSEHLLTLDGREPLTETVSLPAEPTVYGFGGRRPDWPDDFRAFAAAVEDELKLRYGGAMVADLNQTLSYGGIFSYPGLRDHPEGKLRTLFEAAPMAHLVEAAGGASSDGGRSLLDVDPDGLHGRTPVHLGNAGLIERLEAALR